MPYKLLLADDSITIQRVVELTFAGEDVQVLAVGDGEQAIARIAQDRPDIVLADIAMPKRSGYEVAAFVKGQPDFAHIPVLLLAGAFEPVDEERASQVGSQGVLVKPFEPQQVVARVRELLAGATGSPAQAAVADIPRLVERLAPQRGAVVPPADGHLQVERPPSHAETDRSPAAVDAAAPADAYLDVSLDDYFDKLNETFATLGGSHPQTPAGPEHHPGPPRNDWAERSFMEREPEPFAAGWPHAGDHGGDHAASVPASDVGVTPHSRGSTFEGRTGDPDVLEADFETVRDEPSNLPTLDELLAGTEPQEAPRPQATFASPPETFDWSHQPAADTGWGAWSPENVPDAGTTAGMPGFAPPAAPPASPVPDTPPARTIADAFTALLAVEQGEPGAQPPRIAVAQPPVITDELVDELARRVLQRLAPDAADPLVTRIVSEIAERLVREEIDRIKARLQ